MAKLGVIGILGMGEVGTAFAKLISKKTKPLTKDLNFDHIGSAKLDILHVCIPYTSQFEKILINQIKLNKPGLTIISSTIKPGTTASIFKKTKKNIVHSPFMGTHPIKTKNQFSHPGKTAQSHDLFDYFSKFTKFIGPANDASYNLAKNHFQSLGLQVSRFNSPLETELAKILSTTYYGWNIIFEKWVFQLCQQTGADYDQVYTKYNQNYNKGYQSTMPNVVRPVLHHHSGPIGGHCVIPNAQIINQWLDDDFTDFLLKQNSLLHPKDTISHGKNNKT